MSHQDELTSLWNRRHLEIDAREWRWPGWVVRIDLDSFIFVNDHWGHEVGDQALVRIASFLQSFARSASGRAYRVGGDDFLMLLPDIQTEKLREELEGLQEQLRLSDYSFGNHPYRPADHLSASFIAVRVESMTSRIMEAPLNRIDDLLYAERASTIPPGDPAHHIGRNLAKRGFVKVVATDD